MSNLFIYSSCTSCVIWFWYYLHFNRISNTCESLQADASVFEKKMEQYFLQGEGKGVDKQQKFITFWRNSNNDHLAAHAFNNPIMLSKVKSFNTRKVNNNNIYNTNVSIKQHVLQLNHIESFVNVKTIRNDNTSWFTKNIDICLTTSSNLIIKV